MVEQHFEVVVEDDMETMVDIINNKVDQSHGGGQKTMEEGGVTEVVTKFIEVNNKAMAQITTTMGYLDIWQITIIKGNMTWETRSYNKTIIYQQAIKVMNNYLWCNKW